MPNWTIFRAISTFCLAAILLSACSRLTSEQVSQPSTTASSVAYDSFGPRQPTSGFSSNGSVIASGSTGVFGTTDPITVDDSGPFPNNSPSFDASLSDFSADDQALLAGTGIDLSADRAAASAITFPGDDGSTTFFDADIGTTVFFDLNSSQLSDQAREVLRSQAAWLNVHPNVIATVEGHTDERGTREYNLALGERRASSVRGYLTALGVANDRVRKVSFGKERPAVLGSDESAWSQNRRSVTVLSQTSQSASIFNDDQTRLPAASSPSSVDALLNDPTLNDFQSSDPLLNDPLLNDPLLNDPLLNDPLLNDV